MRFYLSPLLFSIVLTLYFSLASNQDINHGLYKYSRNKKTLQKAVINGRLVDKETGDPLKIASVKINNMIIKADTAGFFYTRHQQGSIYSKGCVVHVIV